MLGIVVQVIISFILLRWVEGKNLSVLGWQPTAIRLKQFTIGLAITILLAASFHLIRSLLTGTSWQFNNTYSWSAFANALWWMLRSVLYEELIFRGALFYIALKRLGTVKGLWLSVITFGIYHWFSYGAFGHPVQMIFILLITAAAGWMYAYAFLKTNSLYLPIGLHLGWNCVSSIVFSEGSIGKHLLIPVKNATFQQNDLAVFLFMILYQILIPAFCTWLYVRRLNGEIAYAKQKGSSFSFNP